MRDGAVATPAAVRLADRGPEPDLTGGRVEHVMVIARSACSECLDPLPGSPSSAAALADLERLTFTELQHRPVLEPVRVTRNARAGPDLLVCDGGGMTRADGGADDGGRYGGDLGRAFIVGFDAVAWHVQSTPQPVQRLVGDPVRGGIGRDLDRDLAPATEETAGLVVDDERFVPPAALAGCLPDQRCIVRIDVAPLSGGAIDADAQHKLCDRPIEAEQQPAISRGRVSEWSPRGPGWLRLGTDHRGGGDLAGTVHRVASEGARGNDQVLVGLEDHHVLVRRPRDGHLRACRDRRAIGRVDDESHIDPGLFGRSGFDADEVEQREVEPLGDPVHAVGQDLREPREQLDQRDPRIGDVVLGPLGRVADDPVARLAYQLLETNVVEQDLGEHDRVR